jgi:outer membrane protein W
MKRHVLLLSLLSLVLLLPAGELGISGKKIGEDRPEGKRWFFEVSGMYGFKVPRAQLKSPLEAEIGRMDYNESEKNKELSIKPIFSSNGGGPAMRIGFGHMFNKYIGLEMNIILAFHPSQLDARTVTDKYYASQYTKIIPAAYMAPGVRFAWDNGKRFGVYSKIGLFMPFGGRVVTNASIDDKEGRLLATFFGLEFLGLPLSSIPFLETKLEAEARTQLNPSAGLAGSLGFDVKVNEKTSFFFDASAGFYSIRPKKTTYEKLKMDNTILGLSFPDLNFDENTAPKILTEIVYVNEITETSNNPKYNKRVDLEKPLEIPALITNGSTLYLSAGFRFNMNRWDKKRKEKVEEKLEKKEEKKGSETVE